MDSFEKILLGIFVCILVNIYSSREFVGAGSDSQGSETDVKFKNRLLSNDSEIDLFITNKGVTKDSWKR